MGWLQSFWQKAKKPLEVFGVIVVCALVIALVVVVVLAYIFKVNVPGLAGKNLWDWLQLLIIPAVLAIGGYWFNFATGRTEREIASEKQREDTLQAYIDSMSALLLEKDLRKSGEDDEVRTIARVRTLTVLPRLDKVRKKSVLQFLYESSLIDKEQRIVDLNGADFSRADLRGFYLSGANLSGANLSGTDLRGAELTSTNLFLVILNMANISYTKLINANLHGAYLIKADLRGAILLDANLCGAYLMETNLQEAELLGADLSYASLQKANLQKADLTKTDLTGAKVTDEQLAKAYSLQGATMPDGTKHP